MSYDEIYFNPPGYSSQSRPISATQMVMTLGVLVTVLLPQVRKSGPKSLWTAPDRTGPGE